MFVPDSRPNRVHWLGPPRSGALVREAETDSLARPVRRETNAF